jgi:hypothetical protein
MSGIDERDLPSGTEPDADGTPTAPSERPAGFWGTDDHGTLERAGSGWPTTPAEIPLVDQAPIDDGRARWSGDAPPPPRHRHSRNPVDRLTRRLPDPLRVIVGVPEAWRALGRRRRRVVGVGLCAGREVTLVDAAHPPLLTRLCSRRQDSIRPWSPESSTWGTSQPRYSAGRV